ncbi:MAG TPA: SMC family ATPase [Micromonosporaceae bacterium]|nr:SMC family ATPase [Micromonosporaceae bacterium]
MRPLRLDLAGFTVFRDETTIDFTDADFFAFVGPTGSGKSTILDAICFALYGTVPRWGDRRAIANALAPSAAEARVRLVFESAGARYVVTRVVRRDGKGSVSTRHAGLEALPHGFDLTRLDSGLAEEDLGEVLAGTPAEVEAAVLDVVGLPYEQFTKCVILPQGEFAAFLHAKPAERQRILVNLLGLDVYGRVRERAGAVATAADAQLATVDRLLAELADADDAAVADAEQRVAALRELCADVDRLLPELADAQRANADARAALNTLDAAITRLALVRVPTDVATTAQAAETARAALAVADGQVQAAEAAEERVRAELAAAGDGADLRRLLDCYADRERLLTEAEALSHTAAAAEREHDQAVAALTEAQAAAQAARHGLDAARDAYAAAVASDRAAALRPHLRPGEPCPVCEQVVDAPPTAPHEPAVAAAEAAGKAARLAAERAEQTLTGRDRAVRELDRALAGARARAGQFTVRLDELTQRLAGAAPPDALQRDLAAIARLQAALDAAAAAVRSARTGHRKAFTVADRAADRVRAAWRDFDAARDAVAADSPPPAERDDLAAAWGALAQWAAEEIDGRRASRDVAADAVQGAERAVAAVRARLADLFVAAGVPAGTGGSAAAEPARVAAVVLERAEAALRRVTERRDSAQRMRAQRGTHEREGQVARALAVHLRADRFERWLLTEALDALVDGASRTLRELSGGQYDLGHDKGEFYVVDHHDAGLRRGVRTLSGGETFQASLALALALSEQLAGLSSAAASLESIVLDEGFGTLDASTLDSVTATLENLAAKGDRMVGVVTHVGALAERIPVRFEVRRDARTARVERVGL